MNKFFKIVREIYTSSKFDRSEKSVYRQLNATTIFFFNEFETCSRDRKEGRKYAIPDVLVVVVVVVTVLERAPYRHFN